MINPPEQKLSLCHAIQAVIDNNVDVWLLLKEHIAAAHAQTNTSSGPQ